MHPHNVGGGDSQRAVHKHVDVGQQLGVRKAVEGIDDFLRTSDSKRGDDELPLFLGAGVEHRHQQVLLGGVEGGVQAVAIGRLHDEVVNLRKRFGVFEDAFVIASDVAGEPQLDKTAAVFDFQVNAAAPQDVARIEEFDCHLTFDIEFLVVGHADKATHALLRVVLVVDRLYGRLAQRLAFLVERVHIRHLYAPRIGEHDGAEVARGRGAEHRAAEP